MIKKLSRHTGVGGQPPCHQMSHGGGGSKKCHVLFEWLHTSWSFCPSLTVLDIKSKCKAMQCKSKNMLNFSADFSVTKVLPFFVYVYSNLMRVKKYFNRNFLFVWLSKSCNPQWRNWLAHGTYRQYVVELCRGCEFEPHLGKIFWCSTFWFGVLLSLRQNLWV